MAAEPLQRERGLGLGPETPLDRSMLEPVWQRSRELGFYGIHLPESLGGQGLSYTELAALKEEIGASGRQLATSVLGDMGGPLRVGAIFEHASEHQVEKYLMPVVRGERACCFAVPKDADAPPALGELCAFLAEHAVTKTRWPERLEILAELPMTPTRKVKKGELAERAARLSPFALTPPADAESAAPARSSARPR